MHLKVSTWGVRQSTAGVTLLECVVASGFLLLAVLSLLGVYFSGLNLSSRSNERVVAVAVGRECLERIRALSAEEIPDTGVFAGGNKTDSGMFPPSPYPVTQFNNRDYSIAVEVEPHSSVAGLRTILVTVSWDSLSQVRLQTAVAR